MEVQQDKNHLVRQSSAPPTSHKEGCSCPAAHVSHNKNYHSQSPAHMHSFRAHRKHTMTKPHVISKVLHQYGVNFMTSGKLPHLESLSGFKQQP